MTNIHSSLLSSSSFYSQITSSKTATSSFTSFMEQSLSVENADAPQECTHYGRVTGLSSSSGVSTSTLTKSTFNFTIDLNKLVTPGMNEDYTASFQVDNDEGQSCSVNVDVSRTAADSWNVNIHTDFSSISSSEPYDTPFIGAKPPNDTCPPTPVNSYTQVQVFIGIIAFVPAGGISSVRVSSQQGSFEAAYGHADFDFTQITQHLKFSSYHSSVSTPENDSGTSVDIFSIESETDITNYHYHSLSLAYNRSNSFDTLHPLANYSDPLGILKDLFKEQQAA